VPRGLLRWPPRRDHWGRCGCWSGVGRDERCTAGGYRRRRSRKGDESRPSERRFGTVSPTPWDAVRLVGRSYFVHRFHRSGGGATATHAAWLAGLPLSQRPPERSAERHATLSIAVLATQRSY